MPFPIDFSTGILTEKELYRELCVLASEHTLVAFFTDNVNCVSSISEIDIETLLEIRAFNEHEELYARRSNLNADFTYRFRRDDPLGNKDKCNDEILIETHYLDIDTTFSNSGIPEDGMYRYKTMAGGTYCLSVANAKKILLCVYLSYNNSENLAQAYDYRYVSFICEEDYYGQILH